MSTLNEKKSSKSVIFGAKFVATITDCGEAARQKSFKNSPQVDFPLTANILKFLCQPGLEVPCRVSTLY